MSISRSVPAFEFGGRAVRLYCRIELLASDDFVVDRVMQHHLGLSEKVRLR